MSRKVSKDEADYQAEPKDGRRCGYCSMWRTPGTCTAVEGRISPKGWCRYYKRRAKTPETIATGA